MPVCLSFYASDSKTLTWLSRIRWPKPVKPPKWTISAYMIIAPRLRFSSVQRGCRESGPHLVSAVAVDDAGLFVEEGNAVPIEHPANLQFLFGFIWWVQLESLRDVSICKAFTVIRDRDTIGSKAYAGRRRKYVCEILV
jgi:hypothetical protein